MIPAHYHHELHGSTRQALSKLALSLRRPRIDASALGSPFSATDYDFADGGRTYRRRKIVLAAPGCTAATCTMCPIPNEALYGLRDAVAPQDLINQFHSAFAQTPLDAYHLISVYNSGNWFADREMPAAARVAIYRAVAESRCEGIMIESLPQFVTDAAVDEAGQALGGKQLIVAIGLQSANDFVRHICVNTTCTRDQFERASRLLWERGMNARPYLMIKPPFLTEAEAVEDTASSIAYLSALGYEDVSICPTRIAPYTVVAELAGRGRYVPPSLWTVVDVLERAGGRCRARVACLDLDDRDDDTVYPRGCAVCSPILLETLKGYNVTRGLGALADLDCGCRGRRVPESDEYVETPVLDRIQTFLDEHHAGRSGNYRALSTMIGA